MYKNNVSIKERKEKIQKYPHYIPKKNLNTPPNKMVLY